METATAKITAVEQQSLSSCNSAIEQQSFSPYNSASSFSESNLETLDDIELELERIMFEEFAKGLASDIPMGDF
ncbi:MAG: hypothetical protein V7K25_02095 [Nostoc sp.]|uniref:hypothetical protein n=1 Tax=Nostoc sp. TaxID=1180 RepID=UPI002FF73679